MIHGGGKKRKGRGVMLNTQRTKLNYFISLVLNLQGSNSYKDFTNNEHAKTTHLGTLRSIDNGSRANLL